VQESLAGVPHIRGDCVRGAKTVSVTVVGHARSCSYSGLVAIPIELLASILTYVISVQYEFRMGATLGIVVSDDR
jgi:hypothetical protein